MIQKAPNAHDNSGRYDCILQTYYGDEMHTTANVKGDP